MDWLRCPDLGVRTDPGKREIRQHANNRVCDAVESDVAANDVRVSAHSFPPEIFRDHRHIGGFFFVRQKVAATDWMQTEDVEIVRCYFAAEQLHSVAKSRQRERKQIFGSEVLTNCLASAIMLKPW